MNLKLMRKIASKSTHKYKHCSIIFAGSRLLAFRYNHGDTHAEVMAIRRLKQLFRNQDSLPRNLHIVNFMFKAASGRPGNSYPCYDCSLAILRVGIHRVTYFDGLEFRQMRYE